MRTRKTTLQNVLTEHQQENFPFLGEGGLSDNKLRKLKMRLIASSVQLTHDTND